MILQKIGRAFVVVCAVGLCFGCGKATPAADSPPAASAPKMETIARVHCLGIKALSSDTNAAGVMQIWNLPETAKLESQTLDKLSAAPWRFLRGETNPASTNLLHPLLQDLVDHESYLEIRRPAGVTNAPGEMILAIRVDDERATLWETNLNAAIQSLTGMSPAATSGRRWSLKKHHPPNLIELARAGDWTVIGAAQDHNALLDETLARIQQDHTPVPGPVTNLWLDARVDLPAAISAIGRQFALPPNFPVVSLSMLGENNNVRTRGEFEFRDHKLLSLDAWNIATNLISPRPSSFAAIRGFEPLLAASEFWKALNVGQPPNQMCIWSVQNSPGETYFAAPVPDAATVVSNISDRVLARSGSWFPFDRVANFRKSQTFNGIEWHGLPFMMPFLQSRIIASNAFVFGGAFRGAESDAGPPPSLLPQLGDDTNLVAYEWEMTGQRINQLLYISQFARLVCGKSQLPTESLGSLWLKALGTRLEFSTSIITQTAPGQLSLNRRSSFGFSGAELNLLADWLESPDFPNGLYTLRAPPPAPLVPSDRH